MIDFSCAFDLVWTDALIIKLMSLNVGGEMLRWIKNFLSDRLYKIRIDDEFSNYYSLDNGTPQGSSLSPLLFLVMANDFPELSGFTSTALFADDSTIWRSGSNINIIIHHLQSDLDIISNWCTKWGFKINTNKTTGIIFTNKSKINVPKITINNVKIAFVNSVKLLGVTLDKKLTWKKHIQSIIDNCSQSFNIIRLLSGSSFGSSKTAMLAVYKGLIRSRIDYGCFLYQDSAKTNLKLLDSLQYKALLLCTGGMKGTPHSSLLIECGETSLAHRRSEFYLKFITRIKFSKDSPCRSFHQDLIIKSINKKVKSKESLILLQILSECNINIRSLAFNVSFNPPWSLPIDKINLSLNDILREIHDLSQKYDITDSFIQTNYKEHQRVFVDGSKLGNLCGISMIVPDMNINYSINVTATLSPLTIEMLAILNALIFIESTDLNCSVIFTDSLTAASSIKNTANSTYKQPNPLLCLRIQELLTSLNTKVDICWLPSHIGLVNHDLADFCCRYPLNANFPIPCLNLPNNILDEVKFEEFDVIYNIVAQSKNRWRSLWLENRKNQEYATHLGFSDHAFTPNSLSHSEEKIINRLRLFTCGLNSYLCKIGIKDSALCDTCNVPETVEHFVLHCSKHQDLHAKLKNLTNGLKISLDVGCLLSNNITIKCIISYIITNKLRV